MEGLYLKKHIGLLERFLLLWILITAIGHCILGLSILKICGTSMASTLDDGEYIFTINIHDYSKLKRGDIITFHPEPGSDISYVKRVIGLPGEEIEAIANSVFINGREISFWHGTGTWGPVVIPENAVFVMGDNRGISFDSRQLGCVDFSQIKAKVIGKSVCLS